MSLRRFQFAAAALRFQLRALDVVTQFCQDNPDLTDEQKRDVGELLGSAFGVQVKPSSGRPGRKGGQRSARKRGGQGTRGGARR